MSETNDVTYAVPELHPIDKNERDAGSRFRPFLFSD